MRVLRFRLSATRPRRSRLRARVPARAGANPASAAPAVPGAAREAVIACNPPDFLIHLARPLARRGAGVDLRLPRSGTRAVRGDVRASRNHPSGASCARAARSAKGRCRDDGERAVRRSCPGPRRRSCRERVRPRHLPRSEALLPGRATPGAPARPPALGALDRQDVAQGEPAIAARRGRRTSTRRTRRRSASRSSARRRAPKSCKRRSSDAG